MRRKVLWLSSIAALVVVGAGGYTAVGLRLFTKYQRASAAGRQACGTLVSWNPPAQIFTAFYSNLDSILSVSYHSASPANLRIAIQIPGFTQVQSLQVTALASPREAAFRPPLLSPGVLDALVPYGEQQSQIDLRVSQDGREVCDTSAPVVLKSRLWMQWTNPTTGDNSKFLAAWVTPQDPTIATLAGRAAARLATHPDVYAAASALNGYAEGRAGEHSVTAQVDAIFDTLQLDYHVHYSQDNLAYARDAEQVIQLPKDVLDSPSPSGMCVETTAIMASAVERLGMRPMIVIVPGHAFLGVALGPAPGAPVAYWETSDLNGGVLGNQAAVHGQSEYQEFAQAGQIQRVIDIQYERQQGIVPME